MIRTYRWAWIVCAASLLPAAGRDAAPPRTDTVLAQLPLRFEANQGQFAPAVRFTARGAGYTLSLTNQGANFRFADSRQVRLSLAGSNAAPEVQPLERLAAVSDYYIGPKQNWHTNVPSFNRVRYANVYPGIDLVYYGDGNRLEYDFVLQPGANPDAIRMQFSGGALRLTPEGDLGLVTEGGLLLQKKPVIYQTDGKTGERRTINGRYVLQSDQIATLQLDRYDRSQPLIVDPVISYSTLIGGAQTDSVTAMKVGPNGRLYVIGTSQTGELPSNDLTYTNLTDTFLQIIDTTPGKGYQMAYATYFGGTNLDNGLALEVDAAGFVYVGGSTTSPDLPMVGNSVQNTGAASSVDGFIAKFDPNQAGTGHSLVYSTYLGGAVGTDTVKGVAVDATGLIYAVGTTKSPDFPITDNAYNSSLYGPSDVFVTKIDPTSTTLLYSTVMGSELDDDAIGLVLDTQGVVTFAGTTLGTQYPTAGAAYRGNSAGNYDIVISRIDTKKSGVDSLIYSTYFGGSDSEVARGVSKDPQGRLLLTGYTLSLDFPVTASAMQPKMGGNGDAYVAVFDLTKPGAGGLVYSTYLGGTDGEVGYGVAGDAAGFIYVTGYTLSADFPIQNPIQGNWGGGIDMFLTKFKTTTSGSGAIEYSTYIGVDAVMVGTSLALDNVGNLYVGGYTEGYLPLVGNPQQPNYGGGFSDGFFFVVPGGTAQQNEVLREQRSNRVMPGGAQGNITRRRQ